MAHPVTDARGVLRSASILVRSASCVMRVASFMLITLASACGTSWPHAQAQLGASHNWKFRDGFTNADRIFNGFDFGHAIVYETLLEHPADLRAHDNRVYELLGRGVLRNPPRVSLEEAAVGPHYATLVPEVVMMFSWAHMLHRQIYDVWAAPGLTLAERDAEVQRVVRYYQSRPDLAFSATPKQMSLMEGQPYSRVFRAEAPLLNGVLWSYHWMQMAIYDALMADTSRVQQTVRVDSIVSEFFERIDNASRMPHSMPMGGASAPSFAHRYPEATIIFDNLHALHDVVADILGSPTIARRDKRATILRAAAAYRDSTTSVMTMDEWRAMSGMGGHR